MFEPADSPDLAEASADTVDLSGELNPREKYYGSPTVQALIDFGADSHVGLVRKNNEDHFAVVRRFRTREVLLTNVPRELLEPSTEEAYAYVVADGVGGAACGELASQLALTTAWGLAPRERSWPMRADATNISEVQERMQTIVDFISEAFQRHAAADKRLSGMGTTLTVVYSIGSDAFIGHLGDSRAYLIRDGEIGQLTRDDTLAQMLIESGASPFKVARTSHILTNCLSTDGTPATATTLHIGLRSGDALLLCSDGLSDRVADVEIAELVDVDEPAQVTVGKLIQKALDRGGNDNVTVVLAKYRFAPPAAC